MTIQASDTPTAESGLSLAGADALLRRSADLGQQRVERAESALADTVADYRRLGLPPGALVAIALPNGRDLLTHYFATVLCGLVPVLAPPSISLARLTQLAGHLNVRAYVAAPRYVNRLAHGGRVHRVGTHELALAPVNENHPERYAPGDVVMLTSGTSGMYSACVNRIDSLLRNARRHNLATGVRAGDTILVVLPLYYSYAIVAQALSALTAGARLVIGGPPFHSRSYRTAVAGHEIDISSITPTLARQLTAEGTRLPGRLRTLTVGGDHLTAHQVGELLRLHAGELYLTYGLTEAGPRVATLAAHREPPDRWESAGQPLPGVRVSLRGACDDGIGELIVQSNTVMTRRAGLASGQPLLGPGRLATGDLFRIDEGYLYFRGRLRDFVVTRGEKVSLYSVRLAAQSIPGVVRAQTAVTGGDAPSVELIAYVADPAATDVETVTGQLDRMLMRAERPDKVSVVPADLCEFRK